MISILLSLLVTTALSLTCEEQFSAINTITIKKELYHHDECSELIDDYQCTNYIVGENILISLDRCPNLCIYKYDNNLADSRYCMIRLDNNYEWGFTFPDSNQTMNNTDLLYYKLDTTGGILCGYFYSVEFSI